MVVEIYMDVKHAEQEKMYKENVDVGLTKRKSFFSYKIA